MQNIDFEIETHPLAPFLPKNGKLLMLGSFPPPKTRWKMDFYYPNYQNDSYLNRDKLLINKRLKADFDSFLMSKKSLSSL